jgi:hypothetical protein
LVFFFFSLAPLPGASECAIEPTPGLASQTGSPVAQADPLSADHGPTPRLRLHLSDHLVVIARMESGTRARLHAGRRARSLASNFFLGFFLVVHAVICRLLRSSRTISLTYHGEEHEGEKQACYDDELQW